MEKQPRHRSPQENRNEKARARARMMARGLEHELSTFKLKGDTYTTYCKKCVLSIEIDKDNKISGPLLGIKCPGQAFIYRPHGG